jgi:hypothetical protein
MTMDDSKWYCHGCSDWVDPKECVEGNDGYQMCYYHHGKEGHPIEISSSTMYAAICAEQRERDAKRLSALAEREGHEISIVLLRAAGLIRYAPEEEHDERG